MKAKYYQELLKRGKTCYCGQRATRYSCGVWSCAGCLQKDRAIYGTSRIRGSCGYEQVVEPYRVAL